MDLSPLWPVEAFRRGFVNKPFVDTCCDKSQRPKRRQAVALQIRTLRRHPYNLPFDMMGPMAIKENSTLTLSRRAALLDGAGLAAEIKRDVAAEVINFTQTNKRRPCLAAVRVGDDPASEVYVRNKIRACEEVGMDRSIMHFPLRRARLNCSSW